jgi:hypothetical protein
MFGSLTVHVVKVNSFEQELLGWLSRSTAIEKFHTFVVRNPNIAIDIGDRA